VAGGILVRAGAVVSWSGDPPGDKPYFLPEDDDRKHPDDADDEETERDEPATSTYDDGGACEREELSRIQHWR